MNLGFTLSRPLMSHASVGVGSALVIFALGGFNTGNINAAITGGLTAGFLGSIVGDMVVEPVIGRTTASAK